MFGRELRALRLLPALRLITLLWFPACILGQSSRPGMGSLPYADSFGTGVTFRVWAPNASSVAVAGTFNGWNSTANPLAIEPGTKIWSADVPGARPGHEYKYVINGSLWWKDPRSRKVVVSGYDKPGANSIVYDPKAFDWNGDTNLPSLRSDLVIYELHVGAFYDPFPASGGPGKFADAAARLDYLARLGINAVQLMPVAEFPGDYSWGYNPADLYAVENGGYGGPDGLKYFVREAHSRGIRVLLDTVHNHYGPSDLELYGFDIGPENRVYLYTEPGICCTPWGDRPNYANEGVRSFIIDNFRLWQEEYHLDGFRWDAVGTMRHYDPGYVSIPAADSLISYINSSVIRSDSISVAEDDAFGLGFDAEWAHGFGGAVISATTQVNDADRDMTALSSVINGYGWFRVLFTETHDLTGFSNGSANQRLPKRIDSAQPESYWARKRSMLGAAAVLTAPGTPMLFMGQEFLEVEQFHDNRPLDWGRAIAHAGVLRFYRDMIRLRRNLDGISPGLTGPSITWHAVRNDSPYKLLAFHRWGAAAEDQVMVVMNFSSQPIPGYWINTWPADGVWYVHLNSDGKAYGGDFGDYGSREVGVTGGRGEISVGPYSVLVLSRRPRTDPERPVITRFKRDGNTLSLHWTGPTNLWNVLQRAPGLLGPWADVRTNYSTAPGGNHMSVPMQDPSATFFRFRSF